MTLPVLSPATVATLTEALQVQHVGLEYVAPLVIGESAPEPANRSARQREADVERQFVLQGPRPACSGIAHPEALARLVEQPQAAFSFCSYPQAAPPVNAGNEAATALLPPARVGACYG